MNCIGDWLVLLGKDGRIRRCNEAFREFSGKEFSDLVDSPLADQLVELQLGLHGESSHSLEVCHESSGRWYALETYPFIDENGVADGSVLTARNITEIKLINNKLRETNHELADKSAELEEAYAKLQATQSRIIQQEKIGNHRAVSCRRSPRDQQSYGFYHQQPDLHAEISEAPEPSD